MKAPFLPTLIVAALCAGTAGAQSIREAEGEHRFVLVGAGRFAVMADMVSLTRDLGAKHVLLVTGMTRRSED